MQSKNRVHIISISLILLLLFSLFFMILYFLVYTPLVKLISFFLWSLEIVLFYYNYLKEKKGKEVYLTITKIKLDIIVFATVFILCFSSLFFSIFSNHGEINLYYIPLSLVQSLGFYNLPVFLIKILTVNFLSLVLPGLILYTLLLKKYQDTFKLDFTDKVLIIITLSIIYDIYISLVLFRFHFQINLYFYLLWIGLFYFMFNFLRGYKKDYDIKKSKQNKMEKIKINIPKLALNINSLLLYIFPTYVIFFLGEPTDVFLSGDIARYIILATRLINGHQLIPFVDGLYFGFPYFIALLTKIFDLHPFITIFLIQYLMILLPLGTRFLLKQLIDSRYADLALVLSTLYSFSSFLIVFKLNNYLAGDVWGVLNNFIYLKTKMIGLPFLVPETIEKTFFFISLGFFLLLSNISGHTNHNRQIKKQYYPKTVFLIPLVLVATMLILHGFFLILISYPVFVLWFKEKLKLSFKKMFSICIIFFFFIVYPADLISNLFYSRILFFYFQLLLFRFLRTAIICNPIVISIFILVFFIALFLFSYFLTLFAKITLNTIHFLVTIIADNYLKTFKRKCIKIENLQLRIGISILVVCVALILPLYVFLTELPFINVYITWKAPFSLESILPWYIYLLFIYAPFDYLILFFSVINFPLITNYYKLQKHNLLIIFITISLIFLYGLIPPILFLVTNMSIFPIGTLTNRFLSTLTPILIVISSIVISLHINQLTKGGENQ